MLNSRQQQSSLQSQPWNTMKDSGVLKVCQYQPGQLVEINHVHDEDDDYCNLPVESFIPVFPSFSPTPMDVRFILGAWLLLF